ncbi:signal recognition particle receptor subunit alpha homolog isoform X2 [Eurosta solidaginis]|uniref:signal recognition particle receptor subunit alpha homolog isoform X2 n=1 Tax=Eurosta solidaginis TaxID=178769 RepID=UPI0035314827
MLDYVVVFTKGGIILWDFNSSDFTYNTCINNVIRTIVLEERNTDYKYFENQNLAVQFKLDNELDLVYAVVFQKVIKLNYVEALLEDMQRKFKRMFVEMLVSVQRLCTSYDFSKEYQLTLSSVEKSANKVNMAPKQMRSFNESTKSKKNVASMYDETKTEKEKKVVIQETSKQQQASATTVNFILENRKKLKEKLAGKKSPTECKSTSLEKAGKKPRVWDLGGSAKDAVVLDRSKDQPQDVQYKNIQNDIVGTMQGSIRDLEVESDDDIIEFDERKSANSKKKAKSSGILSYFRGIVGSKILSKPDLQPALEKMRDHLISKNVAADIANQLCESVATNLTGKSMGTFDSIASLVKNSLTTSLVHILSPKRRIDIIRDALEAKSVGRPYTITFCGVNGVGKSTNLAKICFWLIENGFSVLIAACDTFRAGAVEQLRIHTRHLNALHPPESHNNRTMVYLYEKGYGKDAAGIAMEAIKYAFDNSIDIVLVDTAGRMQDNEPLMRSLSKLIKVNDPDLVLFVGEALVGNEAVDQLVKFNQSLADYSANENPHTIDAIVLTKFDTIDDKVGAAISMTYVTGQPIVFVGTGQTYSDLKALNVNAVVRALMK